MADLSDVARLRAQNLSLLKELQRGQHNLRASVRSAVAHKGRPSSKQSVKGILQEKPAESNVQFQRDSPRLTPTSIQHKRKGDIHRTRLTSTPKYTSSSTKHADKLGLRGLEEPTPPKSLDPLWTESPTHLYESFLRDSNSAFGHRKGKSSSGRITKMDPITKKSPASGRKGKSGNTKRKGVTPRKLSKSRPRSATPAFTPSPSKKEIPRPYSVQLETSSLLPPPSNQENLRGQRSRYGYRQPLDLAHEESYYQLNRASPLGVKAGSSFAEQLLADGNDRRQTRSHETTARPKSILLTPGTRLNKSRNRVSFRGSPDATVTLGADDSTMDRTQPLLGYDWIAGLLDSDSPVNEYSELFFEDLRQFRQANREECVHKSITEEPNVSADFLATPGSDDATTDTDKHTCIHNFTLNSRLFAVPLHGSQNGESLCAICNDRRKANRPGATSPSYIRVSIPRSTLASPYRIRPHRRKSYDPTDSVGLSQHCLAGWESSKPSMLPTASNIDLKDSVDMVASNALNLMGNLSEFEKITINQGKSEIGPKEKVSYPSQEPSYQSEKASRISKHTQDLLHRSHALRLDLQKLERVGMSVARLPPGPHSTSYPVL